MAAGLMPDQIEFQFLVDIQKKENLSECLVLPRVVKNKVSPGLRAVTLLDHERRAYGVRLVSFSDGRLMLTGDGWQRFVRVCIERNSSQLCFRLRRNMNMEVVVFDNAAKQVLLDANGEQYVNRCLIEVTGETIHTEYTPLFFLDELNVQYRRDTDRKATIYGLHQVEDVEVIYEDETQIDEDVDLTDDDVKSKNDEDEPSIWRAVALTGSKWTHLCTEEDVEEDGKIMLTNLGGGFYLFDYFNDRGVGSAAAVLVSTEPPASVRPSLSEEYATESDGEDVENTRHRCNIAGHQHNLDRPSFFKKLTEHSFTTNGLTVPNHFVRANHLDLFTKACVYVGSLKFKAKLEIMYDARKDEDQTHVVLMTDWAKVSKKCGVDAGKELRFELNVVQLVDGHSVEFHVC